jgi:hypothetical protein
MRNKELPRLVGFMQWQAILSTTEATACLADHRRGSEYSSEAVNHYGGTTKVIKDSIRNRHVVRRLRSLKEV